MTPTHMLILACIFGLAALLGHRHIDDAIYEVGFRVRLAWGRVSCLAFHYLDPFDEARRVQKLLDLRTRQAYHRGAGHDTDSRAADHWMSEMYDWNENIPLCWNWRV